MSPAAQDRLLYAQNWEDSRLEVEALEISSSDVVLATAGGGCTALSLLGCAPRRLLAVDRSDAQLRLLALKLAAVRALSADAALAFLDPASRVERLTSWSCVRELLSAGDREYWDERQGMLARGVLGEGRAERFLRGLGALLRCAVHPRDRIRELFRLDGSAAQRRFYAQRWNTRRWRLLFRVLDKRVIELALGGSPYSHVTVGDLGEQLRVRAERCLLDLPVNENFFLSRILLGEFLVGAEGRPDYLKPHSCEAIRDLVPRIELRHTDLLELLRQQPASSIDKFYLSNVAEWMPDVAREALFREVARVGRHGGRVTYRALMLERPLPPSVRATIVPEERRSLDLERRDRAFINASFKLATIHKPGLQHEVP